MEKEFKEAKKRKDKATNAIRKTIEDFLNEETDDYDPTKEIRVYDFGFEKLDV